MGVRAGTETAPQRRNLDDRNPDQLAQAQRWQMAAADQIADMPFAASPRGDVGDR
jgi:hypothetical protein